MSKDDLSAFNWLNSEFDSAYTNEMWSPDEAFDCIWMMYDADWQALYKTWPKKGPKWKVICVYVLGHGPAKQGKVLLKDALTDTNPELVREAALALTRLALIEPDQLNLEIDVLAHIQTIAEHSPAGTIDEIQELIKK